MEEKEEFEKELKKARKWFLFPLDEMEERRAKQCAENQTGDKACSRSGCPFVIEGKKGGVAEWWVWGEVRPTKNCAARCDGSKDSTGNECRGTWWDWAQPRTSVEDIREALHEKVEALTSFRDRQIEIAEEVKDFPDTTPESYPHLDNVPGEEFVPVAYTSWEQFVAHAEALSKALKDPDLKDVYTTLSAGAGRYLSDDGLCLCTGACLAYDDSHSRLCPVDPVHCDGFHVKPCMDYAHHTRDEALKMMNELKKKSLKTRDNTAQ